MSKRKRIRSVFKWILWVLIVQFILINVSAVLYAHRLTYFYESSSTPGYSPSKNVFIKTWKLFSGPKFQKTDIDEAPHFPFETIHLLTKANLSIESWYMPVDSPRGTVILFHGLGANKSTLLHQAYEFYLFGFNVMLVDLRAHGNSSGNVTTIGFRESEEVKLAYEYILKKGERNIILYGISLGAVVIAKAIYDFNLLPSGIILEMPFDSLEKLFGKRGEMLGFPEEPFGTLVTFWASIERGFNGFNQNTSLYAEKIKCPVLMQYGASDKIVSVKEINSVFKHIASADKKLVRYENADHHFLLGKDPEKWRKETSEFLIK